MYYLWQYLSGGINVSYLLLLLLTTYQSNSYKSKYTKSFVVKEKNMSCLVKEAQKLIEFKIFDHLLEMNRKTWHNFLFGRVIQRIMS